MNYRDSGEYDIESIVDFIFVGEKSMHIYACIVSMCGMDGCLRDSAILMMKHNDIK